MHLLLFQNLIYLAFLTAIALCRYDMPCAFFVGANPHTQSTLFACALLADEKVPNYRWAFDKFKICMSGKSPRGIITDQCKAISNAFKLEFPEARHRLCLWHIMRKVPTKRGISKKKDAVGDKTPCL